MLDYITPPPSTLEDTDALLRKDRRHPAAHA